MASIDDIKKRLARLKAESPKPEGTVPEDGEDDEFAPADEPIPISATNARRTRRPKY